MSVRVPALTHREIESLSQAFNYRYGVTTSWSDRKINRALADYKLPDLSLTPDYGVGSQGDVPRTDDAEERHRIRRRNAMHRLGHIIAKHPAEAIESCLSCVEMNVYAASLGGRHGAP